MKDCVKFPQNLISGRNIIPINRGNFQMSIVSKPFFWATLFLEGVCAKTSRFPMGKKVCAVGSSSKFRRNGVGLIWVWVAKRKEKSFSAD